MNLIFIIAMILGIILLIKREHEYDYQDKDSTANYLPWGYLIGDDSGVIYNKNGSFSKTYKFVGVDTDSNTINDLALLRGSLNNVLKILDGNWAIHVEARNKKAKPYKKMNFIEPILQKFENIREKLFNSGNFYESTYFITYTYLPPADLVNSLKSKLIKEEETHIKEDQNLIVEEFKKLVNEQFIMIKKLLVSFVPLNDEETLTYFHSCFSNHEQIVKPMPPHIYLDSYLSDVPIVPGLTNKIGDEYVGVVSILHFSKETSPNLLDKLNKLPFEYRWVTRFIYMDKEETIKLSDGHKRKWGQNRKSTLTAIVDKAMKKEEETESNDELEITEREAEADSMRYDVSTGSIAAGYYTLMITFKDKELKKLDEKADEIVGIIQGLGFIAIKETLNSLEAFFGSMPANCVHHIRRPVIHTMNLIDLLPISAIWSGDNWNKHLNAPPLLYCTSNSSTPFKFNLHQGQVGHTAIFGMTGAGKSVFLCTLEGNFKKYDNSQVIIFDKGASSQVLTTAVGGKFYNLGHDELTFQPLANIDQDKEREWAFEWICSIFENEKVELTPELRNAISKALLNVASMDKQNRTITSLYLQLHDKDALLSTALKPYTNDGSYGRYFDGNKDDFRKEYSWQVFEMETLLETRTIVAPITDYIFHKLETEMFNGKPTILVLDEFSNLIRTFESKVEKWLRELRKYNVSVVFATQSLTDVVNSNIKDVVLSSCPTKIYLPYKDARIGNNIDIYRGFGLNDKEIEIISTAIPQQDYYYKSSSGNRLFELKLSQFELAYYGASSKEDKLKCSELINECNHDIEEFNKKWQEHKRVSRDF